MTRPNAAEHLPSAGLIRRLAALLYECLLLLGYLSLSFMVPLLAVGLAFQLTPPGGLLWLWLYAVLGLYFTFQWRKTGQTLAMQTWGIRVEDARSGNLLNWRQAWIRYTLCWPSLALLGAGLLWCVLDPEGQFLHDRLTGSRVVRKVG